MSVDKIYNILVPYSLPYADFMLIWFKGVCLPGKLVMVPLGLGRNNDFLEIIFSPRFIVNNWSYNIIESDSPESKLSWNSSLLEVELSSTNHF